MCRDDLPRTPRSRETSRLDRRAFLKTGAIALLTVGAGPAFLQRAARAVGDPGAFRRRKTLVTIFQRGAMDGLMAVPPLDDPHLQRLRPRLHMSAARRSGDGVLELGDGFGLHPALGELLPFWRDGDLAVVHGVGSPDPTRSHFDAQDYMETGTPGRKGTPDGWLDRVAGELGHDATPFRSVALTPALPRSLYGDEGALAVSDLRDLLLSDEEKELREVYGASPDPLLRRAGGETFEAVETLERLDVSSYRPAPDARYPDSPLGRALRQIAFLVKSDVGLEIAFAESGGWDTHVAQGTRRGNFARRADDLSRSVAAFWRDLGAHRDDVTLMTMTEFGRTVAENGTAGTDHGHGSCLFVLGGGVDGGKVHGRLPELAAENLYEGRDLPVTTDFRSVFHHVATEHFGLADDAGLFPGWSPPPAGPRLLG